MTNVLPFAYFDSCPKKIVPLIYLHNPALANDTKATLDISIGNILTRDTVKLGLGKAKTPIS